ncbi:MAG: hypothetical protein Q3971_04380 [Moraxella sp.]|nr:hypothetical protein [Moraxella sp.]
MNVLASHEPFLQSKAQLLVLPVSTDGNICHPVVARCKSLFFDNYDHYYKKAIVGELSLGDALVCRLNKQLTGLGVQTGRAEYIANIVTQKSPTHPISTRMFVLCLKNLKPQLYELMRYKGIRRVAMLGSALLVQQMTDEKDVMFLTAERVLQICYDVLGDVPKMTLEVHFGRDVPLPVLQKTLEN